MRLKNLANFLFITVFAFSLVNCGWKRKFSRPHSTHVHASQVAGGARISIILDPSPPIAKESTDIEIHLVDESTGVPLEAKRVEVQWFLADFRATETQLLSHREAGVFTDNLTLPKVGNYKAQVEIDLGDRQVYASFPVSVDGIKKGAGEGGTHLESPSRSGGFGDSGGGHAH